MLYLLRTGDDLSRLYELLLERVPPEARDERQTKPRHPHGRLRIRDRGDHGR